MILEMENGAAAEREARRAAAEIARDILQRGDNRETIIVRAVSDHQEIEVRVSLQVHRRQGGGRRPAYGPGAGPVFDYLELAADARDRRVSNSPSCS